MRSVPAIADQEFWPSNTLFVSEAESLPPRLVADTGRAIL